MGHRAHSTVQIRRWWDRDIRSHLWASPFSAGYNYGLDDRTGFGRDVPKHVTRQDLLANSRIHDFVHQPKSGHRILGVKSRRRVARRNLRLGEFVGKRSATHE